MSYRVERTTNTQISNKEEWITVDNGLVLRMRVVTNSSDLDIHVHPDGGDDIGVNTSNLEEYGVINPNNGFWLSRKDTAPDPSMYYVMWKPQDFIFDSLDLAFTNKVNDDRLLKDAKLIYKEVEEDRVVRETEETSELGRKLDVTTI